MNVKTLVVCVIFLSVSAFAAPPSDESAERFVDFLEITRQLEEKLLALESMNRRDFSEKLTGGKEPTREQEAAVDRAVAKVSQIMRDELAWSRIKPGLIRIVQESFSQDELDGILGFYATPTGRAYREKWPLVQQRFARLFFNLGDAAIKKLEGVLESELDQFKSPK